MVSVFSCSTLGQLLWCFVLLGSGSILVANVLLYLRLGCLLWLVFCPGLVLVVSVLPCSTLGGSCGKCSSVFKPGLTLVVSVLPCSNQD